MADIDIFDRYLKGELSQAERKAFESRLDSDKELASEFNVYVAAVIGICKEAEQDNLEFGMAMKRLTKEQLRAIIGAPKAAPLPYAPKRFRFKPWMRQVALVAAEIAILVAVGAWMYRQSRYDVYDAIYACADKDMMDVRSGQGAPVNIDNLTVAELKAELPALVSRYEASSDELEMADNGYILALAYLRLHDRDNAQRVLESLVDRFEGNPDFEADVKTWKSILALIK